MHRSCLVKAGHELTSETWTELLHEVEFLLGQLFAHGRAYMSLNSSGPECAFVQIYLDARGRICAEAPVTVGHCGRCRTRVPTTPEQDARLAGLGWRPPSSPGDPQAEHPLWWREPEETWFFSELLFTELLVRTLREVFEVDSPKALTAKFGNAPHEGPMKRKW